MKSHVSLSGGLGNQLFQAFFADSLNNMLDAGLILDTKRTAQKPEHQNSDLRPVLDIVQLEHKSILSKGEHIRRAVEFSMRKTFHNTSLWAKSEIILGTFVENGSSLHPVKIELSHLKAIRRFVGYFQHAYYFQSLPLSRRQEWRMAFGNDLVERVFGTSVGLVVHVRLGDYRRHPKLYALGSQYYDRCLKNLETAGERHLVSDEPDSEEVSALAKKWNLKIVRGITPLQTIDLIARSQNIVMANSSLSFAGSLLSKSARVFAPSEWGDLAKNLPSSRRGSFPKDWTLVDPI